MPSQFFTVVNNQFNYTFSPLPGVTTYDFVVIGAGGGGGQGNGAGGNGAVVQTTFNNISQSLAISIGGGGGGGGISTGPDACGGGGGGYTQVSSNQVNIIAGGGGGGYYGNGGSGGMPGTGNGQDGFTTIPGANGKGAVGLTPGNGGSGLAPGNNGVGKTGGNGGGGTYIGFGTGGTGGGGTGGSAAGGGGGGAAGGGGGGGDINYIAGGGGGGAGSSLATGGVNTLFSPAPYTNLLYGTGGVGATTTIDGLAGISGYVLISWQTPPPTPTPTPTPTQPISNICFPAGTLIKTDQGMVAIDQIDTSYHTIGFKRILDITQTTTLDRYLVKFPKDCLGPNWPSADTIMTKDHKVMYANKLVPAYKFLNISRQVKRVMYNGEIVYNVLMEKYDTMNVNNLICETLHPDNLIAKIYRNRFTDEYNDRVIYIMNDSLERRKYYEYKTIINRIHSATF